MTPSEPSRAEFPQVRQDDLGAIFDTSQDGFAVWQRTPRVDGQEPVFVLTWINEAGAAPSGLPPNKLVGRTLDYGLPKVQSAAISEIFTQALTSQSPHDAIFEINPSDGLRGTYVVNVVPISEEKLVSNFRMLGSEGKQVLALTEILEHDQLTGLFNRTKLEQVITDRLAILAHDETSFGVGFMDLDYFKKVNDHYGHRVGDALLIAVANKLTTRFGTEDFIARLSGDEFVVVVNKINSQEELEQALASLLAEISESVNIDDFQVKVNLSVGFVMVTSIAETVHEILRQADREMYTVKHSGRNNFSIRVLNGIKINNRERLIAYVPNSESGVIGPLVPSLFHDYLELSLRERDLILARVNITNLIWINSTYGRAVGTAVMDALEAELLQLPRLTALGAISASLFGLVSEDISLFANFLDSVEKSTVRLNAKVLWPFNVEIAVGSAIATSDGGIDAGVWIDRVNLALMDSIRTRRTSIYREGLETEQLLRTELGRLAIDSHPLDGMHWVFQPIVDLATMRYAGYETLARWTHPTFGEVAPDRFIPMAENMGIIHIFDRWAIEAADQACAALIDGKGLFISVNLSALSVELDPELADQLSKVAERWKIKGRQLVIEMTESTLIADIETMANMFLVLHDQGVLLAIDDFGKEYSSLSMLAQLDIDIIKIDESIIHLNSGNQANEFSIIVKNLASAISASTLAEGIESESELELVRNLGIDLAQGFYLCRPQPPEYFKDSDIVCRPITL
jgi:diguanylate cyclase (GGDEF)-like protein